METLSSLKAYFPNMMKEDGDNYHDAIDERLNLEIILWLCKKLITYWNILIPYHTIPFHTVKFPMSQDRLLLVSVLELTLYVANHTCIYGLYLIWYHPLV